MDKVQPSPRIRVLIADDHPVVRQGLASIVSLHEDLDVVGEAGDGEEAIRLFRDLRPDVLMLDLRMPHKNGLAVVSELVESDLAARILIMTTYDSDEDIARVLLAGAKGYLLKDARGADIVEAIRTLAAGGLFLPPQIAAKYVTSSRRPLLTPREAEILRLLADGKSNKTIARLLMIEENTVKTHAKKVFEKLGAANRTEAFAIAVKRGLVRPASSS